MICRGGAISCLLWRLFWWFLLGLPLGLRLVFRSESLMFEVGMRDGVVHGFGIYPTVLVGKAD